MKTVTESARPRSRELHGKIPITPALLLDAPMLHRNLALMEELLAGKARLRPHAKTHKSPEISKLQIEAGAIGITTATVWEALAMAQAGLSEILIANEVVGRGKVDALLRAASLADVAVAVDSVLNAGELSAAAVTTGTLIGVLVDVDVGLGRCGVRSLEEAFEVASAVSLSPGLRLRGVMGYEGHCTFEPDRTLRADAVARAMTTLLEVADALRGAGFELEIVSGGGTGTYDMTGAMPGITEIQAGSYALMDTSHGAIVSGFESALTVLTTVVSRHGQTIVLDAGRKTIGLHEPAPALVGYNAEVVYVAEEHTVLTLLGDGPSPNTQVELIPSYCPIAVNLHHAYHVVEGDSVVDRWPIVAQGNGWGLTGSS
jgi:D-serine deaminase-like pyridoxal phosphate-dependent protein